MRRLAALLASLALWPALEGSPSAAAESKLVRITTDQNQSIIGEVLNEGDLLTEILNLKTAQVESVRKSSIKSRSPVGEHAAVEVVGLAPVLAWRVTGELKRPASVAVLPVARPNGFIGADERRLLDEICVSLKQFGHQIPEAGPERLDGELVASLAAEKAGRELEAEVVVYGTVVNTGRTWEAHVRALSVTDGRTFAELDGSLLASDGKPVPVADRQFVTKGGIAQGRFHFRVHYGNNSYGLVYAIKGDKCAELEYIDERGRRHPRTPVWLPLHPDPDGGYRRNIDTWGYDILTFLPNKIFLERFEEGARRHHLAVSYLNSD
jgi:hypothetical protein